MKQILCWGAAYRPAMRPARGSAPQHALCLVGKDALFLRAHWAHTPTVVAVVAAHVDVARTEEQAPRAARVVRVERARPAAAERASAVERTIVAIPCSGQEYGVAVFFARNLAAINSILRCPLSGGVAAVDEFLELLFARHTPSRAPVYISGIVLKVEFGFVVGKAIVAIPAVVAVLGHRVI